MNKHLKLSLFLALIAALFTIFNEFIIELLKTALFVGSIYLISIVGMSLGANLIAYLLTAVIETFSGKPKSAAKTQEKIKDEKEAVSAHLVPCKHGYEGAAKDPYLCPTCFADYKDKQMRDEKIKQIKRQQEEKERQEAKQRQVTLHEQRLLKLQKKEYLENMDPIKFEHLMCEMFEKMGYRVERTAASGDSGADGILFKNGKKYILQAKRVKSAVGEPILRDLYGTMLHFKADKGIVATTGKISRKAQAWLKGKPIKVYEIDDIIKIISEEFPKHLETASNLLDNNFGQSANTLICRVCGSNLVRRRNKKGQFFYGCESWPGCTYTRSAKK